MKERMGRRARQLLLYRCSLARYIRMFGSRAAADRDAFAYAAGPACGDCTACGEYTACRPPVRLAAKAEDTSVAVRVKPDKFSQLLWGAQSWRRPH